MGISLENLHKTSLIHLGNRGVLKGLFHTLKAIMIPTTVS